MAVYKIVLIVTACAIEPQTQIGIEFQKSSKKHQIAKSFFGIDFQFFNRTRG